MPGHEHESGIGPPRDGREEPPRQQDLPAPPDGEGDRRPEPPGDWEGYSLPILNDLLDA